MPYFERRVFVSGLIGSESGSVCILHVDTLTFLKYTLLVPGCLGEQIKCLVAVVTLNFWD